MLLSESDHMALLLFWMIIQLIAESFPISSSGHVVLFQYLVGRLVPASYSASFFTAIALCGAWLDALLHVPTLLIYALYFFKQWYFMLRHMIRMRNIIVKLALYLIIIDGITACAYFIVKVQRYNLPLWFGFACTGLSLYSLAWVPARRRSMTWATALVLGCVQSLALLPGFSRLALTFVAASWMGMRVDRALQLSCLMQVPLLLGAVGLALLRMDFSCIGDNILNLPGALAILSATGISWFCFCFTMKQARAHSWSMFAYYMAFVCLMSMIISGR